MIKRRVFPVLAGLWLTAATAVAGEPLSVFVSVIPQQTFVERIGGERVAARAMVGPGDNPHAYEPKPSQIAALRTADLYVRIGDRFEEAWLPRIQAANPALRVIDARDGIVLRNYRADERHLHAADGRDGAHDHGHEHEHDQDPGHAPGQAPEHAESELDTHIWTSPPLVKIMAAGIRDALTALSPGDADAFAANHAAFVADLDALDAAIRARLEGARTRSFLVQHPAWGYFAETYGLRQIAIEQSGKEPGARALAALIDQARAANARVVFVQPQFSPRAAEQLARAIGGRVVALDPLASDYFDNLRRVADLIAEADEATETPRP